MNSSSRYNQRTIFFEGNSLFALKSISATPTTGDYGGEYITSTVYANFISGRQLNYCSLALEARNGTQILASAPTAIVPFIKANDIIVYWEGTNDMYTNSLTGAQAWANVTSYLTLVQQYAPKIIICTVIARDYSLDPAGLMNTEIPAYNTLVRNNTSLGYTLCDLANDPLFDARADASNATYYCGDKLHLITAGQNQIITLIQNIITSII